MGALAVFSMVGLEGPPQASITCGHTLVEFKAVREPSPWAALTIEGLDRKGEDTHRSVLHCLGQLLEAKGMEAEW